MTTKPRDTGGNWGVYTRLQAELEEYRDMLVEASYLRTETSGPDAGEPSDGNPGVTARNRVVDDS